MKLTPAQADTLRKIVATNGGGISPYENKVVWRVVKALEAKGLVQGKSGSQHCAVHTREGMDWVRSNPAQPVEGGSDV